jgi:DtxR family Mn-dependent transcriptional regulator
MQPSVREDYLEAVLIRSLAVQRPPNVHEIAEQLHHPEDLVKSNLENLAVRGDLMIHSDGGIELTRRGNVTAERVLKKHRVLQCFFREMLGMDDRDASDEACVLEHEVSDHTIERLDEYIEGSGEESKQEMEEMPGGHRRRRMASGTRGTESPDLTDRKFLSPDLSEKAIHTSQGEDQENMKGSHVLTLLDMEESSCLVVAGILPGGDLHRLIDLGVIPGEKVLLRRKLGNRAVVIQVKGCDIALSPEIAGTILVEKKG